MGIKASSNRIEYVKKSASSSSLNAALSIPSSPFDIEVEHLETFILVWLDSYVDEDEQNQTLQKRLRQYVTYLVTFDDSKLCEQWLKNRSTDEKILFIVSGDLGKKIVPNIHQLTSINAIYIFCWKPEIHTIWTQNFSKVRGVISKSEELLQKISKDQIYFENIEDSKAIKIFRDRRHTCILDLESTSFVCYQLLLEIIISTCYLPSSGSPIQLIEILRRYTSNDQEGLNLIKQFEQTYNKQQAVTWLTNNTPLARFVNKTLRELNISMLFYLRFFLIDIYNQLINHHLQSAHVYRKQIMSSAEIENIRINVNNYLMLNEFLYTSTKQSELSSIDINDNQYETVFIEIYAENEDGTAPFASIEKMVNTNDEQNDSGILFMCGSIFKIVSLTKNINSIWTLELSLASDKHLNTFTHKKQKLRQTKDLLIIVDLLDQCNQLNKANIYCQHLLRELPSDHVLLPKIKEKININTKVQPVSLRSAQFILIDLSGRLSELASAMLDVLRSLTNDSILMFKDNLQINFDNMLNKTILLFASSQIIPSIPKLKQLTHLFILEEDKNNVDQQERFYDSEDLIFQLADELYRYYKWEANDDLRSGDHSLAEQKEELANRIHNELKKVHQIFSQNDNDNKPPICITTTLVWLKSESNNGDIIEKVQNLFKDIVSSFSIIDNAEECYGHVCTTEIHNIVFLIIDNDYKDISVAGFQYLNNVKQVYRYDHCSSSTKGTINSNPDNLCLRLTHDFISHYNQLGNECDDRNDPNNAKDMFLKARKLCELLIKF